MDADLVVLSQDLFDISADAIPRARVLRTIVGGRVVHSVDT
jgi:predicted amidohydrolase YtcJ